MSFTRAVSTALSNYVNFSGRSARPEYWYFALFLVLVGIAASLIDLALGFVDVDSGLPGPLSIIFTLATILPGLSVSVRRLHDIGRSGWWVLISLVPIIGVILLIYWACQRGEPQANAYGSPMV
jgi:uncharacterized membrane protein YhaH (DUF805 family)